MKSYLIATRYSKSGLQLLRELGFGDDEITMCRCAICNCKTMIHPNSLAEWVGVDIDLICSDCERIVNSDNRGIVACTPTSQAIFERAMNNLRRN